MTNHGDQLREAFATHENQTPDAAAVYARVQELSRGYKWRRRGLQAAGGVALTAGVVAGVVTVPQLLPSAPADNNFSLIAPGAAPSSIPVSPSPTVARPSSTPSDIPFDQLDQRALDAYFEAGYGYDEAEKLAKLWKLKDADMGEVKAEAGRKLLAGETLPVRPDPTNDDEIPADDVDPADSKRLDAFFNAGYSWNEAEKLAKLWKLDDPTQAKIEAGKRLLAGEELPVKP